MKTLHYSYNPNWINKTLTKKDIEKWEYWCDRLNADKGFNPVFGTLGDENEYKKVQMSYGWINVEQNLNQLFNNLTLYGYSVCSQIRNKQRGEMIGRFQLGTRTGYRNSKNFVKTNVVLVDIDDGSTIEQLKEHLFYKKFASGFYTTPSHTEQNHRMRIVFITERIIDNESDMRAIYTSLISLFGADKSCKDAARIFYGCKNAQKEIIQNKVIPNNILDVLIEEGSYVSITTNNNEDYLPPDDEEKKYILDSLKGVYLGNYEGWLQVAGGLKNGGFSLQDFEYVTINGLMRQKSSRDCQVLWNGLSLNGPRTTSTLGTIWFLIGGKNKYMKYKQHQKNKKKVQELDERLKSLDEQIRSNR